MASMQAAAAALHDRKILETIWRDNPTQQARQMGSTTHAARLLRLLQPALRWVPFVTHWKVLAVLWLQVTYFLPPTSYLLLLTSYLLPPTSHLLAVLWLQLPIIRAATRLAAPALRVLVPPMLQVCT